MPQIRKVKSLFDICAEYVASNMDSYTGCTNSHELVQTNDPILSNNPFDVLTTIALEKIVEELVWKMTSSVSYKGNKAQHFEILMTNQLTTLKMSSKISEMVFCINVATLRCQQLKILKLNYSYQDVMHLCALKFKQLKILDISYSSAGDNCLQIIGTYCKHLIELNVKKCKEMTDAGMRGLCLSVDHLGEKLGPYKTIEHLNISGTRITNVGAQIAIENFRSLKFLTHGRRVNVVQILCEMHQHDYQEVPKYLLSNLMVSEFLDFYPHPHCDSLSLVVSLCPSITSVEFWCFSFVADRDLLHLRHLKNLCRLSVDDNSIITLDGGVYPLLRAIGSSLEYLELAFFLDINLRTIAKNCPNLRELTLVSCCSMTLQHVETNLHSNPVFNYLEKLCIFDESDFPFDSDIPFEIFVFLLSSPILKELQISECHSLTDDVFKNAFELNKFKCLESLTLDQCHSISKKGIDVLMNDCNPLSHISIDHCNSITAENVEDWGKKSINENWQLYIDDKRSGDE